MAANTPHIVFEAIRTRSSIPLVSIVHATCEAAKALNLKRLGLFGTRFTMEGRFYPDVFSERGIDLIVPEPDERVYIHDKYMNELVKGVSLRGTRDRFLAIVRRMKDQEGLQGLILAGTELPLILRDIHDGGFFFLDTTQIHVRSVVTRLLS
jgi:aspartate racemase